MSHSAVLLPFGVCHVTCLDGVAVLVLAIVIEYSLMEKKSWLRLFFLFRFLFSFCFFH